MSRLNADDIKCVGCLIATPLVECKTLDIFGEVGPACPDCQIWIREINSYTEGDKMEPKKPTTALPLAATPTTYGSVAAPAQSYGPAYTSCRHHLTPFSFGKYTVYLTGSSDADTAPQADWPTAGVYLATSWLADQVASTDAADFNGAAAWPSLFVGWPDRQVVGLDVLGPSVKWAKAKLDDGCRLEIACQGGHGRTGTFVAALMVAAGMDVVSAFELVRTTYCKKAIETREQGELLVKWSKQC